MIYTLTLNPSIDYLISVSEFRLGCTNRSGEEYILPGGKGINVSMVLENLGLENVALGFIAGFTGEQIEKMVTDRGIRSRFITLERGISRINVKLQDIDGTEINGAGPFIPDNKLQELMEQLDGLSSEDILILSGSVSASVPKDIYAKILNRICDKNVRVVVDASGELLVQTLEYNPFLIKPNLQELAELFGKENFQGKEKTDEDLRKEVIPYGVELHRMGARNVLISLGGAGAVLIAENGNIYSKTAPVGEVVSTVGSGDSMVAGFVAGWLAKADYEYAFCMGLAAGSAGAFSKELPTETEIMEIFNRL